MALLNHSIGGLYSPWTYGREESKIQKGKIYQYVTLKKHKVSNIRIVKVIEDKLEQRSGNYRYFYIKLMDMKTKEAFRIPEKTLLKNHVLRYIS